VRGTKDQARCQRCYLPALGAPLVPTELLDDGVEFSIAATAQPEAANELSGLSQSALPAFRIRKVTSPSP